MDQGPMVLGVTLGFAIWMVSVVGGVRLAVEKNRSPHWMWLGVFPPGAVIVLVAMAVIAPRVDDGGGWDAWARRRHACGEPYCLEDCLEPDCPSERVVGAIR